MSTTEELVKVKVTRITCVQHTYLEGQYYDLNEHTQYYYLLKFDEGRGKEKRAFVTLCRELRALRLPGGRQNYYQSPTYQVEGSTCYWTLRADILSQFADRMQFEAPLETLMDQAREAYAEELHKKFLYHEAIKQYRAEQQAERQARYEREREWFGFTFDIHSQVDAALSAFGLSKPVTKDDIKRKYRELAKQHHPDLGGNEAEFKRINNANQVLMRAF